LNFPGEWRGRCSLKNYPRPSERVPPPPRPTRPPQLTPPGSFFFTYVTTNLGCCRVAYWPQSVITTRLDSNGNYSTTTTTNCRLLCKYDFLPSFLPLIVCGLGHGSSALSRHIDSVRGRMTAGIKFRGKWGGGAGGRESVLGLDGTVVDPTVANKLWGGRWGWFCVAESWVLLSGIGDYFAVFLDHSSTSGG